MAQAVAVPISLPVAHAVAVPIEGTAQPIAAVAQPIAPRIVGPPSSFYAGVGYLPAVPAKQWESDICDCTAAGGGMCWLNACCPFITAAQLYQKTLGRPKSCIKVFLILFFFYALFSFGRERMPLSLMSMLLEVNQTSSGGGDAETSVERRVSAPTAEFFVFSGMFVVGLIGYLVALTCVLTAVRKRVRQQDQIRTGNVFQDCCCSWCCGCCVMIQIFRQFKMREKTGYKLCTEEGAAQNATAPLETVTA